MGFWLNEIMSVDNSSSGYFANKCLNGGLISEFDIAFAAAQISLLTVELLFSPVE